MVAWGKCLWSLSNTNIPPARPGGVCVLSRLGGLYLCLAVLVEHGAEESSASERWPCAQFTWSSEPGINLRLICVHFRCRPVARFPWTRDGSRRKCDWWGKNVCGCVTDGGQGDHVELVGGEKWNELRPWCVVPSAETPEQPDSGLLSRSTCRPDPFHVAASLARHTCVSVESGEAIDYRASWHSIDDQL